MDPPGMARGLFEPTTNEVLRAFLPSRIVDVFEVLTHFGDGVLFVVAASVCYAFSTAKRRERWALLIAIGLAALALSTGLKGIVGASRPELAFAPPEYPGYSFPSAHALGAAAFYGTLAVVLDIGSRLQRGIVAGLLVGLVALSRVVIGVHYLGDVLIGLVLGLGLVVLALSVSEHDPIPVFLFALAVTVVSYGLGAQAFTATTTGAVVGGILGWAAVRDRRSNPGEAAVFVVFGGWFSTTLIATLLVSQFGSLHPVLSALGVALATATLFTTPLFAAYLDDHPLVARLQAALPVQERRLTPGDGSSMHSRR